MLILFAALVCGMMANAKMIYLNTGGNNLWGKDAPAFYAHAWGGAKEYADVKMSPVSGDIFSANVDDDVNKIIFVRQDPNKSDIDWNGWNKTGDLEIPSDKNQYNITGWGKDKVSEGNWSSYSGSSQGGGEQGGEQGGDQGGNQGGGSADAHDYYLKGYFNGKDVTTPTAEEQFEGGKLTYTFTGDSKGLGYFFILVCEKGAVVGECYMAKEFSSESHCTLYNEKKDNASQKMGVPAGTVTFYLYDNGDGTYELSTQEMAGKTLVGGGAGNSGNEGGNGGSTTPGESDPNNQAVENTFVGQKAHKVFIDGQLRIVRGDKMFDATGRQL